MQAFVELGIGVAMRADEDEMRPTGGEGCGDGRCCCLIVGGLQHGESVGGGQTGDVDAVRCAEQLLETIG